MTVIDVSEATFEQEVVERSHQLPVVVDFWAAWCGPCRALGPVLEQAAGTREGRVVLAKVDTDANPQISASFGIQGIPAVKAFQGGRVTKEFVGAQPPAAVERFFDALVGSEADDLVGAGDEASLRRALDLEPGHTEAAVALARLRLAAGDREQALALVEGRPGFAAEGLAARLELERDAAPERDVALLEALGALDDEDPEPALTALVDLMAAGGDRREALRKVIVGELDRLGVEHPVAREVRRRLAAVLY
ncbi:MAG TPA: tetratricopeptide repeat protein [Solirubrobacteraceae bacterium]|jgi:putative thioredoxin|nr:tetratricopeptide repeat protein [Solirubrobacteraceae bacterium]